MTRKKNSIGDINKTEDFSWDDEPSYSRIDSEEIKNNFIHLISEASSVGFLEWFPPKRDFIYSESLAKLLGYQDGQLPLDADNITAHIYSEDYPRIRRRFVQAYSQGTDFVIEFRMHMQSGEPQWFQLTMRVIEKNESGKIRKALGSLTNIDFITKAMERWEQHAETEKWINKTISDLLMEEDNAKNKCLDALCQFLDADHALLREAHGTGKTLRLVAYGNHPSCSPMEDIPPYISLEEFSQAFGSIQDNKPEIVENLVPDPDLPSFIDREVKPRKITSYMVLPIFYQGRFDYYLSVICMNKTRSWSKNVLRIAQIIGNTLAMVAARKKLTREFEKNEIRFQNALDATQDGLWDWNIDTEEFYVSPSFLYMLGYDEEYLPLTEKKINHFFTKPNNLNSIFSLKGSTSSQNPNQIERRLVMRHREGNNIPILLRGKYTEWNNAGKPTRCVGINIDLLRYQQLLIIKMDDQTAAMQPIDESLSKIKILLVEDNPINQQVARGILERKGVKVTIANNGKEGVDILEASPLGTFDIVLMDMEMPIMDGYEATRVLRSKNQFSNLPIVALTAHAMPEDRARCLSMGMNDHIPKPVKPDLLYETIAKYTAES